MSTTDKTTWEGDNKSPFGASYGKLMMWFFIVSDALTFSGFLVAYGLARFKFIDSWPIADEVFTHVPFVHGSYPMYYVAFMTFVLIFSSVTMVLGVAAGKAMKQSKVTFYLLLTVIGGVIFLGSQAWEWKTFIKGEYGAVLLKDGKIAQFVDDQGHRVALHDFAHTNTHQQAPANNTGVWYSDESDYSEYRVVDVQEQFLAHPELRLRLQKTDPATHKKVIASREVSEKLIGTTTEVVQGANLRVNEYGTTSFANYFFFITGFHGFHVLSGVVLNIIVLLNVLLGTYQRRGSYEMVEKVGLYWHFVDLVWVFVFTFFYLV